MTKFDIQGNQEAVFAAQIGVGTTDIEVQLMTLPTRYRKHLLAACTLFLALFASPLVQAQECYGWMPNFGQGVIYSTPQQACAVNNNVTTDGGRTYTNTYTVGSLGSGSLANGTAIYECNELSVVTGDEFSCHNGGNYCVTNYWLDHNTANMTSCSDNSFNADATAKLGQTSCCNPIRDPINPALGNVYETETDVRFLGSPGAIVYQRFYDSADSAGADDVPGWRHSYDRSISSLYATPSAPYSGQSATVSSEYSTTSAACTAGFADVKGAFSAWAGASVSYSGGVCIISNGGTTLGTLPIYSLYSTEWASTPYEYDVIRDDGQTLRFTVQGGTVTAPPGVSLRLSVTGSGFTVTDDDDNVEVYNSAGVLQSVTSRAGVVQTIAYDGNGLFLGVTDSFGNSLTVTRATSSISAITLSGGGTVQYAYDGFNRLIGVTNLDGTTRSYQYGSPAFPDALTALVDENGTQYSSWGYDSQERATSTQEAGGAGASTITYNSNGSVTWQDALGATRTFSYTRVGDINQVAGISGSQCPTCRESAATTYDAAGWVASRTDYDDNVTCFANDSTTGLELVHIDGFAPGSTCPSSLASYAPATGSVQRKIATTWSSTFRLPTQIVEATRTTSFTYDSSGNLLTRTLTDTSVSPNVSRTWTYTYDSYGHVLTAKGPRTDVNGTTTYAYYTCTTGSECGQLHTVTDAVGNATSYGSYNTYGQPLTITDPNGVVTTLTYDARERLASQQVGTETTGFAYYPTGLLSSITNPDASTVQFTYDAAHRLTKIQDGAGNSVQYTLDAMGNRTATSTYDPSAVLARTSSRVYNTLSELYQQIGAAGTSAVTTNYGYDANGNRTAMNAPLTRNTSMAYDALNRVKQIIDPASNTTALTYDADDNLLSAQDPVSLTTSYQYDGFDELLKTISPATGTTTNTYDPAGDLATSTDARAVGGAYSYDADNRLTQAAYGDQTITYTYDAGTYGKGRLTGASDTNHTMSWQYDAQGRVTSRSVAYSTATLAVGYAYTQGNLTTLTTPSGQTVTFSYADHRVSGISVNGSALLYSVGYDPFGPARTWSWGNGGSESRLRDFDGNPSQFSNIESVNYTVDSAFRIVQLSNASNSNLSWTDSYDSLDRITAGGQVSTALSWTYDGDGNRLSQGGASAPAYTASSLTMAYNHRGRMSSAQAGSGTTTNYIYDALGERIGKSGTSVVLYAYDEAGHLLGEYTSSGALIQETVWLSDLPVATIRPDPTSGVDVYYVHTDHLGTPKIVSRPVDNAIMWRWDQDPFGSAAPNQDAQGQGTFVYNLRFPGQYYDAETGLSYNYARDYDPQVGRYAESDPIGLRGGSYSTYAYVGGNPISRTDPMGLTWPESVAMGWAWLTGSAPPNTVYGPLTNQSQDMMQSPGVQNAINYFNQKNAGKCPSQWSPVTNYDYSFGLKGLWQAGLNSTQQFVGSYSVNISPNANGTLDVQVNNTTSMTSFLYGIYPNALNPPNGWPMGNTSQQYVGTLPASTGATNCGCGSQ